MLNSLSALSLVLSAFHYTTARLHSLPEDPHAFPKFKVTFLNNLPVLNETAQKWLNQGIPGGELEFLNQPWENPTGQEPFSFKEIDGSLSEELGSSSPVSSESNIPYSLEHMKMGPRDSYLCLVPNPLDLSPPSDDETDEEITPARTWSLLQPLSGTCLYHRQGWFTYSYCHNDQIRQFRELQQTQSHIPEEDHSSESYTLGKAPATPEPGAELTVAERNAIEANLELARGAGSQYLVQRWGDGTICDKTGKGREVEVQFHCSMTMSDHILFVKEAKTCSYVLVINTPRLCGEPGFRSHHDVVEQAQIRCREIVHTQSQEFHDVPEADYPQKIPRVKKALPSKVAGKPDEKVSGTSHDSILLKTIEAILGGTSGQVIVQPGTDAGEMVIEFLDEFPEDLDGDDFDEMMDVGLDKITDALRAAGYDVKGNRNNKKFTADHSSGGDEGSKKQDSSSDSRDPRSENQGADDFHRARDEL